MGGRNGLRDHDTSVLELFAKKAQSHSLSFFGLSFWSSELLLSLSHIISFVHTNIIFTQTYDAEKLFDPLRHVVMTRLSGYKAGVNR